MPKKFAYHHSADHERQKTKLRYGIFGTHIELFDDRILTLEGCRGVTDYTDCRICCHLKKNSLLIYGTDLDILSYEEDRISIGGHLVQIEFCQSEG